MGASASTAGSIDGAEVHYIEHLRYLCVNPTSRGDDSDLRFYVCVDDNYEAVELTNLSLTTTPEISANTALPPRRAISVPSESLPILTSRLRSDGQVHGAGEEQRLNLEDIQDVATWNSTVVVPLQELSAHCWWARVPAPSSIPGFSLPSLWTAEPAGAPFNGQAILHFKLRLAVSEMDLTFQVDTVGSSPCSRVVFVVVKSQRSMTALKEALLHDIGPTRRDVVAEEAMQTYRTLVGGIWQHLREPRLDDMDAYTACWEHGLLLAFMLRRGRPRAEARRPILTSAFRPEHAIICLRDLLPCRWDINSRIQLWCFVGQVLNAVEELRGSVDLAFAVTEPMWELYDLPRFRNKSERISIFKEWIDLYHACGVSYKPKNIHFRTAKVTGHTMDTIVRNQHSFAPDVTGVLRELKKGAEKGVLPPLLQKPIAHENSLKDGISPIQREKQLMVDFVVSGLHGLYIDDCASPQPTFGWIRTMPLLCDFCIVNEAADVMNVPNRISSIPNLLPMPVQPIVIPAPYKVSMTRSSSVRADEIVFEEALRDAYQLLKKFENACDFYDPVFASIDMELVKLPFCQDVQQITTFVQKTKNMVENLKKQNHNIRSLIDSFERETHPVCRDRVSLLRQTGFLFSKSSNDPWITTLAGNGSRGHTDGESLRMACNQPEGVAVLPDGRIVFTDRSNCLRCVSSNFKHVTTLAGMLGSGVCNGPLGDSTFHSPRGLCVVEDDLIIADSGNHCIRKVTWHAKTGPVVTTLAGSKTQCSGFQNGKESVLFNCPVAVTARSNGVIVVCDRLNRCLRAIQPDGTTCLLAGVPNVAGARDGPARRSEGDVTSDLALLQNPRDLTTLSDGSIIFSDGNGIRLLADGKVTTVAGHIDTSGFADGIGRAARFKNPAGLVERAPGFVLVADRGNQRIRELDLKTCAVVTVAGTGQWGWSDGFAKDAEFNYPTSMCVLSDRTIICTDCIGNRLRRMFLPDSVQPVRELYDSLTRELLVATEKLEKSLSPFEESWADAEREVVECGAQVRCQGQVLLISAFEREVERFRMACLKEHVTDEEVFGLVIAAPSLGNLTGALRDPRVSDKVSGKFVDALKTRVEKQMAWDLMSNAQAEAELASLAEIVLVIDAIPGAIIVGAVFASKSFHEKYPQPGDSVHLLLLGSSVKRLTQLPDAHEAVRGLERAIRSWLRDFTPSFVHEVKGRRRDGKLTTENRPPEDIALDLFQRWVPIVTQWEAGGVVLDHTLAAEWLPRQHIRGVLFDDGRRGSVLVSLEKLCRIVQGLPVLETILSELVLDVAEVSKPTDVMKRIQLNLDLSGMSQLHLDLFFSAIWKILQRIVPPPVEERNNIKELGEVQWRKQATDEQLATGLQDATMVHLLAHQNVWSPFICWFVRAQPWFDQPGNSRPRSACIIDFGATVCQHFRRGFADLDSGALSINVTRKLFALDKLLLPVFQALELNEPELLIERIREDITSAFVQIEQLKKISTLLFPGSPDFANIFRIDEWFSSLTVQQIRWFLGRSKTLGGIPLPFPMWHAPIVDPPEPIAPVLVNCTDWITHQDLLQSTLLEYVWDKLEFNEAPESLYGAADALKKLADSLDEQTILFGELRVLSPILNVDNLARLSSARCGIVKNGSWLAVKADSLWVSKASRVIADWQHIYCICENAKAIHNILAMLSCFGSRNCCTEIKAVDQYVSDIEDTAFPGFDGHKLSRCACFVQAAAAVHPALTTMNAELVTAVFRDSLDLVDWLRTEFADDRDFTSAVEIAAGCTEMECPAELWETGTPGRVSEAKLSQLKSVRTFLHPLVYRLNDNFDNMQDLIDCVAAMELRRSDEKIKEMIQETNALLIPLTELLSEGSEGTATNRLLQMMLPERGATWLCQGEFSQRGYLKSNLSLRFRIPRLTETFTKVLHLDEILDWQSQIVLGSRGNQISNSSLEVVSSFIASLDSVKEINELLLKLHVAGHFEYQLPWFVQYGVSDTSGLRSEVLRMRQLLSTWQTHTQSARMSHYFLNFFGMRQIWLLCQYLGSNSAVDYSPCPEQKENSSKRIYVSELQTESFLKDDVLEILQATVTEEVGDRGRATVLLNSMKEHFNAVNVDTPWALLKACGEVLDKTLRRSPSRQRLLDKSQIEELPIKVKDGLNLICSNRAVEYVLMAFAQFGILPERETLVLCNGAPYEMISNLVLRWGGAAEESRLPLYCLVNPDKLPLGEQMQLANAIRDALTVLQSKPASLLLICSNDSSHIVSQFEDRIVTLRCPSHESLRRIGLKISSCSEENHGVCVYHSAFPGAGKSFRVRTQCADFHLHNVHVPVNSALSAGELLGRIRAQKKQIMSAAALKSAGAMLHLDLSASVQEQFDLVLFELLVLGSLVDAVSGCAFAWHPVETAIAVEVASGSLLGKLKTCNVLKSCKVEARALDFVTDRARLQVGMGEDFSNAQFDGCITGLDQPGENAYGRLCFVVKVLQQQEAMGGSFPTVFDSDGVSLCSSEAAFLLLKKASKMFRQHSLWCLWSYINVMFWQLREMSDPDGPLQGAVMPDPNAENPELDLITKEQIKGQLINFASTTATEFATRQIKKGSINHVGLTVSGMSISDFCGWWEKMNYLNEGEAVYQKHGSSGYRYLLYFRSGQNYGTGGWVIDDVITPKGAVFSSSDTNSIHSTWTTRPPFKIDPHIRLQKVSHSGGYRGESVTVNGSSQSDVNGTYVRQPPYDDIDGEPHYIFYLKGKSKRKHLFWNAHDKNWVICPQCNTDEGTDAISLKSEITGGWCTMPALHRECYLEIIVTPENGSGSKYSCMEENKCETQLNERNVLSGEKGVEDAAMLGSDQLMAWDDSNHEAMLFSNYSHTVTFLSQNPEKMKAAMHPSLVQHLDANHISVGERLDSMSGRFHEILSALTNVTRDEAERAQLMPDYQLTGDALLKMLAIFVRVRCGIPVILMGECGCGKTYLIRFLCTWLGAPLETLDVHGGTTESDILRTFDKAIAHLESGISHETFVFLDEANTCAHMGIITEAICSRSLNGRRLPDAVKVLAAVNPFRKRSFQDGSEGLVFKLGKEVDPISSLVYRVHSIPLTLEAFVFDFGALTSKQENLYIRGMVKNTISTANEADQNAITIIIGAAHKYCRSAFGDPSAVSLRDVKRCLGLLNWFLRLPPRLLTKSQDAYVRSASARANKENLRDTCATDSVAQQRRLAAACTLAVAHVYWYRHGRTEDREGFWTRIWEVLNWKLGRDVKGTCFRLRGNEITFPFAQTVQIAQERICSKIEVEAGIAMNEALSENLFVTVVCILNRIPIFLVGKPGTSKTLTLQILANNLNGTVSSRKIWRRFPAIHIIQYQCSPLSTADAITTQFEMACSFQENAEGTICVLLLDEVGLAEHSPEMPLKALHKILIDPPIAVVGLSNWVLDAAKMNRAVLLMRSQPSEEDLVTTAQRIIGSMHLSGDSDCANSLVLPATMRMSTWLSPLAVAYHEVYTNQRGRDFIGMRDFYQMIKLLRKNLSKGKHGELTRGALMLSICRSFGGKEEILTQILTASFQRCFRVETPAQLPSTRALVQGNLADESARHLMLLTRNGIALPLLFATGLINKLTPVLFGSNYSEDQTELFLIKQINSVKEAMAEGSQIVLMDTSNIYESLYDVLNQRYVTKMDKYGKQKRMLRLAIGTRSQLCTCAPGFRIIVVVSETKCYQSLDLPLLNRFEKQLFSATDLLGPNQHGAVKSLLRWLEEVIHQCAFPSFDSALFCFDNIQTIPSLVLSASNMDCKIVPPQHMLRERLARLSFPLAVFSSDSLKDALPNYFESQGDLAAAVEFQCLGSETMGGGERLLVLTRSPAGHLDRSCFERIEPLCFISILPLVQLTSAEQVSDQVTAFFFQSARDEGVLLVQCDPIQCSAASIGHALHVIDAVRARYEIKKEKRVARHVVVLMHLPPAAGQDLDREFSVEYRYGWVPLTVDDIRPGSGTLVEKMLATSLHTMLVEGTVNLHEELVEKYPSALATCLPPSLDRVGDIEEHSYTTRIKLFKNLLENANFVDVFLNIVTGTLERSAKISTGVTVEGQAASGFHKHVELVISGRVAAGTLRQSLHYAIDMQLMNAFVFTIAELDVNFNLALAASEYRNDWFVLANCPAIINMQYTDIRSSSALEGCTVVPNLGATGPLISRYPFSWQVEKVFQEINTFRTEGDVKNSVEELEQLTKTFFGDDVTTLWGGREDDQLDFLHDFVAMRSGKFSRVALQMQLRAYASILRGTRPDALHSPAKIYAAATNYGNEKNILQILSILSLPQITIDFAHRLLTDIECLMPNSSDSFDYVLLESLLNHLWTMLLTPDEETWILWFDAVSALAVDVDNLLIRDKSAVHTQRWLGLKTVHIYLSEVGNRLSDEEGWVVFSDLYFLSCGFHVELWVGKTIKIVKVDPLAAPQRLQNGERALKEEEPFSDVVKKLGHPVKMHSTRECLTFDDNGTKVVLMDIANLNNVTCVDGKKNDLHSLPRILLIKQTIQLATQKIKSAGEFRKDCLQAIAAQAADINTRSAAYCRKLCLTLEDCVPSVDVIHHFFRRFVAEILQYSVGCDNDMVHLLVSIISGRERLLDHLPLRRTALQFLYANSVESLEQCQQSTAFRLLLLEFAENRIVQQAENRIVKQGQNTWERKHDRPAPVLSVVRQLPDAEKSASVATCLERKDLISMRDELATLNGCVSRDKVIKGFKSIRNTVKASDFEILLGNDGEHLQSFHRLAATLIELSREQGRKDNGELSSKRTPRAFTHARHVADIFAVAELKNAIRSYCMDLVLQDPTKPSLKWDHAPDIVRKALLFAKGPRRYALRCLHAIGGIDTLANVMCFPIELVPWLPVKRSEIVSRPTLVDPFPFVDKNMYAMFVTKVHDAAMMDSALTINQIENCLSQHVGDPKQMVKARQCVLAAYYSVILADERAVSATGPGVYRLRHYIRKNLYSHQNEKAIYSWFANGCPLTCKESKNYAEHQQLSAHLAVCALAQPGSWLHTAMCDPKKLGCNFIPTMPDNEFAVLMKASGYVGWYKCANGHPYSVGNCTMPMEEAYCPVPGCGCRIGGTNHISVKGVTRLNERALAAEYATPGYFSSATTGDNAEVTNRTISVLALRLLRFFLHASLQIALQSGSDSGPSVAACDAAHLVQSTGKNNAAGQSQLSLDAAVRSLSKRMEEDWEALQKKTSLSSAALTLSLHLILKKSFECENGGTFTSPEDKLWTISTQLTTPEARNNLEYNAQHYLVEPVLAPRRHETTLAIQLEEAKMDLEATSTTRVVRSALGEQIWLELYERDDQAQHKDSENAHRCDRVVLDPCLWCFRTPVSFGHFCRWFSLRGENAANHPLLACFLKNEARLHLVKGLADVLEWHAVLFGLFGNTGGGRIPLGRATASEMTNKEAIALVTEARRPFVEDILDRFCSSFNACFVHVRFLYECQTNPFLRKTRADDGSDVVSVDLSGTGSNDHDMMSGSTPLAFSLPNQLQGETDAQGLCTIRLIEHLETMHNELLSSLATCKHARVSPQGGDYSPTAYKALPMKSSENSQSFANNFDAFDTETEAAASLYTDQEVQDEIQTFSYLSDPRIVRRHLINYDREKDFLPLLSAFSSQSIEPGRGASLEYDLPSLEAALSAHLLEHGAAPLAIAISHFHYHGEIRAIGVLGSLDASVAQEALPETLIDQIWNEVSTANHMVRLLAFLETVVRFICNIGSNLVLRSMSPTTRLETFVIEVLLIPPQQIVEVLPPSLIQNVNLSHLSSLYKGMDERANGNPIERIAHAYCEPLPDALLASLQANVEENEDFDGVVVIAAMRDLITEQLTDPKFQPDQPLGMYIDFASPVDLACEKWFQDGFPKELRLAHTFEVFKWLNHNINSV